MECKENVKGLLLLSETPEMATRSNSLRGWSWKEYPVFKDIWWAYGGNRGYAFFVKIEDGNG